MPPQLPKAVQVERVNQVRKLVLSGALRADVVRYVADQWGLAERTADHYLKKVADQFRESALQDRDAVLGKLLDRYETLYAKALTSNKLDLAIRILSQLADLLGLKAPRRVDLTSGGEKIELTISPEYVPQTITTADYKVEPLETTPTITDKTD